MFKKILKGIWSYLKDWKNLLTHALIGVAILSIAIFMPVRPIYRIGFLVAVVIFNIIRMGFDKKKKNDKNIEPQIEKAETEISD